VLAVHVCRCRLEDDVGQLAGGQQCVHTVGRGPQPGIGSTLQALAGRVDADHPDRLDHAAALQLVEQVGADVARPDGRRGCLCGHVASWNVRWTEPSGPKSPRNTSPGRTSTARVHEPGRMMWPALSRTPNDATLRASQATDVTGLPSTASERPT